MTTEQLEQRLQNIESKVSQIVGRLDSADGPNPKSKWWEKTPPLSEEVQEAWNEADAYGRYYRKNGKRRSAELETGRSDSRTRPGMDRY